MNHTKIYFRHKIYRLFVCKGKEKVAEEFAESAGGNRQFK
jgi:hypothetical protein